MLGLQLLHCVLLFLLLPWLISGDNRVCSYGGRCFGDPVPQAATTSSNRMTCPASDCDGTGLLQHHFASLNDGTSASCQFNGANNNVSTRQNSYLRCFRGSLCATNRLVEAVSFGVSLLTGPAAVLVTINLYKGGSTGCDSTSNVADLYDQIAVASTAVTLSQGTNILDIRVPFSEPVLLQSDETILVEVSVPDLRGVQGVLNLADSNEDNQCDPSYIFFSQCDPMPDSPLTLASLGLPSVSHMITLETTTVPPAQAPVPALPTLSPVPPPITLAPATAAPVFSPAPPPNGSPVPAPPAFCLSDRNMVFVQGRGCISIAEVRVGDCVAADAADPTPCTRVYSLAHYHPNVTATFLQFYGTHADGPLLEITGQHLVFSQGKAVPAADLHVGDVLDTTSNESVTIARIDHVQRQGVYAPLTESGELQLLVSSKHKQPAVRVSTYVDFWHGRVPYPHTVVHALALPVRSVCRLVPAWCAAEQHDALYGYSSLYSGGIRALAWMGARLENDTTTAGIRSSWQQSMVAMSVTAWMFWRRKRWTS